MSFFSIVTVRLTVICSFFISQIYKLHPQMITHIGFTILHTLMITYIPVLLYYTHWWSRIYRLLLYYTHWWSRIYRLLLYYTHWWSRMYRFCYITLTNDHVYIGFAILHTLMITHIGFAILHPLMIAYISVLLYYTHWWSRIYRFCYIIPTDDHVYTGCCYIIPTDDHTYIGCFYITPTDDHVYICCCYITPTDDHVYIGCCYKWKHQLWPTRIYNNSIFYVMSFNQIIDLSNVVLFSKFRRVLYWILFH